MILIKIHMDTTPPNTAANTPNALAAFRDEVAISPLGKDERSDDETHIPLDAWKLYSPRNATPMSPTSVIVATLMKRQDDTAREERTNPEKERHHSVILKSEYWV
mmetsp:Transcript_29565/g.50351  ORF Transcript_29565/g.50351 Transcript_29565/m.50351 type:complete len:105 (-) Transcript_29565:286-600(-)